MRNILNFSKQRTRRRQRVAENYLKINFVFWEILYTDDRKTQKSVALASSVAKKSKEFTKERSFDPMKWFTSTGRYIFVVNRLK